MPSSDEDSVEITSDQPPRTPQEARRQEVFKACLRALNRYQIQKDRSKDETLSAADRAAAKAAARTAVELFEEQRSLVNDLGYRLVQENDGTYSFEQLEDSPPSSPVLPDIPPADPVDPPAAAVALHPVNMPPTGSQIAQIPKYDGSTDAEVYIDTVERVQTACAITDAEILQIVMTKLEGQAAMWLRVEQTCQTVLDTKARFLTAFRARFKPATAAAVAMNAVSDLRQKDSESVRIFYERVVMAVDAFNHTFTAAEKKAAPYLVQFNSQLFTFFGVGLRPEIAQLATAGANPPQTPAALLAAALDVERRLAAAKNPRFELSALPAVPAASADPLLQQLTLQMEAMFVRRFPNKPRNQNQTQQRSNQGQSQNNSQNSQNRPKNEAGNNSDRRQVTCWVCGKTGHMASTCYKRADRRQGGSSQTNSSQNRPAGPARNNAVTYEPSAPPAASQQVHNNSVPQNCDWSQTSYLNYQ